MKKIFTLICMAMFAHFCFAEVLLEENFDYPLGDYLTDHGWYTEYESASAIGTTNGLSVLHYAPSGIGNAALIDCVSSGAQPHKEFNEVTEGDVYVAFMFLPSVNNKKGYFFALRDKNTTSAYNFNARVFLDADYHIGLTFSNNQKAVFSDEVLDASSTYLVVVKYSIASGDGNDSVSLYLLQDAAKEEPATATIGPLYDESKQDINPANVVLRGYDGNGWLVVDGLRVATRWEEAVLREKDTNVQNYSEDFTQEECFLYDCLGNCLGVYSQELLNAQTTGVYIVKTNTSSRKVLR